MITKKPFICVIDFEATCWENKLQPMADGRGYIEPRMEIIEFGCVMLDSTSLETASEFQTFVKPSLNPKLSDFCKTLTTIKQEEVDRAPLFPEALAAFTSWRDRVTAGAGVLFASWGYYDRNQLKLDCDLNKVAYPFDEEHLNIKLYVAESKWGGKGVGVGKAADRLGLAFEGTQHRGLDDARMITKVLRKVEGK